MRQPPSASGSIQAAAASGAALVAELAAARQANIAVDRVARAALGQFMTPLAVAQLMAAMFAPLPGAIRLLDPGAGTGTLTTAFVADMAQRRSRPASITASCYEIDPQLLPQLRRTLALCAQIAKAGGIAFRAHIHEADFITAGAAACRDGGGARYHAVIMNPPYRKMASASRERSALRSIGIETVNLYTGFMAVAARLLVAGGQLVSISPRSFCNGPYYLSFRRDFLAAMAIRRLHVFAARDSAFGDDAVLQENVIVSAARSRQGDDDEVVVSESLPTAAVHMRRMPRSALESPSDPQRFLRIPCAGEGDGIGALFAAMATRLSGLGVAVSTGPVVDFRLRRDLATAAGRDAVPLLWACNLRHGAISHPVAGRKPQWIRDTAASRRWLVANERYVLIKRFSTKEEKRRLVAAVHDPAEDRCERLGIENHLNYIHRDGRGLAPDLAAGIAAYLNSGLLDAYFRQFSGHTQVNATDLRALPFPDVQRLEALGREARDAAGDPGLGDRLIRAMAAG